MSKPKPARYRTSNWSSYNDALRKRGSLLIWLDKEMSWHVSHEGRAGRPPVFSNAAIQFCLSIKVLFKLPLRQTAGMVASLLRLAGLDWPVPDYSTLCRRQKTLKVQIPYPPLPQRRHRARRHGNHTDPKERSGLGRGLPGCQGAQRNPARHALLRSGILEAVDRISRPQPRGSQDAMPEGFR